MAKREKKSAQGQNFMFNLFAEACFFRYSDGVNLFADLNAR